MNTIRSTFVTLFLAALPPLLVAQAPPADTEPAAKTARKEAAVYDEAADAKKVVAAAVAKAKKENQRVLIQWGANWCGWCKLLANKMRTNAGLSRELLYEYQVVHVDVGQFDKNMDLAKSLGADFKAIPYLTILDGDGKAIVQQNTEPFETKDGDKQGHDAKKLLEFLKQNQCKPLDANVVLTEALATAKSQHKMVFLHFGAPWCPWCHRLEDWMAQPEIAALLAKDFLDVKIDNDRMTGGKGVFDAQMAKADQKDGGIPWFVFLDGDGGLLAHSTGPKGNTGFPYQPEEVVHFVTMLNTVKKNLTADDVAALQHSLDANREVEEAKKGKRAAPTAPAKTEKARAAEKHEGSV